MRGDLVVTVVSTMMAVAAVPVLALWWATPTGVAPRRGCGVVTVTISADTTRFQEAMVRASDLVSGFRFYGATGLTAAAEMEATFARLSEYFTTAPRTAAEQLPLEQFLLEVRPGSGGDRWTWDEEFTDLWGTEPRLMAALTDSIRHDGQKVPVMVGDDGRLWDGHHRVCALMCLGRPVLLQRYLDLDDDEQTTHLLEAIDDLERRPQEPTDG